MQVGWNSRNSNSVRSRTVSAAAYDNFVQARGVISSDVYQKKDGPNYKHGNRSLLSIAVARIFLYLATKLYIILRTRFRSRQWDAMTESEWLK
ncbi:hypothetical protein B0A48_06433 [Cryoendolithus antarcticus]|uniref:Uncharacterized protein n=1 Tax=Cryoendolithus antarcticus TaxID=1507870 RepID=A0A1V8TAY1_9PEZI|nr:hypothetical protein B0A48_06433 [Cryoendolithus antarcticus]